MDYRPMQYHTVLNSINRGVLSPVYLLCGEEEYLQEHLLSAFKDKLVDPGIGAFNFEEINGEKAAPGEIVDSANTLPVFAEKRLVIVKNAPFLQKAKRDKDKDKDQTKDEEAGDAAEAAESKEAKDSPELSGLINYLHNPLPSTCLIFALTGAAHKGKKIVKAIEKSGQIVQLDRLKGAELSNWLQEETRALGKKLEPRALEYIVLNGGDELRALSNELKKIALYAGNEVTITLPMVEMLLTRSVEANIFTLVDSIGLKKGEKALLELRGLLTAGEPAIRALFMIARQFRLLLLAKDLARAGFTEKQISAELSQQPFVTAKILRQARNFSFAELEDALRLILECDVAMKTGAPHRQTMEDLILKLIK
ncbi:MAG: DNA polymerase III subunit delta [Clostridia bacterium]|jgi:DNA polymerase-3 subunit delta|nr:DNA polymerase III subunit delta [Clostridia bacterium]